MRDDRLFEALVCIDEDAGDIYQPRTKTAAEPLHKRIVLPFPNYVWLHPTASAPSSAIDTAFQCNTQRFAPRPASIRVPIPGGDTQCPYNLIRLHHVFSEPRHL